MITAAVQVGITKAMAVGMERRELIQEMRNGMEASIRGSAHFKSDRLKFTPHFLAMEQVIQPSLRLKVKISSLKWK